MIQEDEQPELTAAELAEMRPAKEVFSPEEYEALIAVRRNREQDNTELVEIGRTSRGYTLYRQENTAGGHTYWSDEIGGGVVVWDTCLVDSESLKFCLAYEENITK